MYINTVLAYSVQPVSVVYFRAGYTPNDYPGKDEWAARLLIEQSSAVKCPSVAYQLAGAAPHLGRLTPQAVNGNDSRLQRHCHAHFCQHVLRAEFAAAVQGCGSAHEAEKV
jgi:hypothetical protein